MTPVTGKAIDERLEQLMASDEEYLRLVSIDAALKEVLDQKERDTKQISERYLLTHAQLATRRRQLWAIARAEIQGQQA